MGDLDGDDLAAELADLDAQPTVIPEARVRAALDALGVPKGSTATVVDSTQVPMMLVVTDSGEAWKVGGVVNMPRLEAVALLRAIADGWDLDLMGVSDD
jgi:hypothetical protein